MRHRAVVDDPRTVATIESMLVEPVSGSEDDRLRLMFVCAHPAIDASVRAPLMLQTVLGLDAARIAGAFGVAATTMSQRLVRAKQKIRDAGVPFDPPEGVELRERLEAVLEGIYAAFGVGWSEVYDRSVVGTSSNDVEPLDEEALFLARLLATLLPDEPEALGLLALVTFSHARKAARRDATGAFVPLAQHDVALWDREAIVAADALLLRAASLRRPGPFQLEAAIQSAHCQRLFSGRTPWLAICTLYQALNHCAPNVGTRVAHAASLTELGRFEEARMSLRELAGAQVASYAPYWVVLGRIAGAAGDQEGRRAAIERAIETTRSPALRAYLASTLDRGARTD